MNCKKLVVLWAFCAVLTYSYAQNSRKLAQVLELIMPDSGGVNGASVVWHPKQQKYYTSFAGNQDFPMAVFTEKGKRISSDELTTGADVRGLWYDANKKAICGNAYSDGGWFKYKLDEEGIPYQIEEIIADMHQPIENSVGFMDASNSIVCFLQGQKIMKYTSEGLDLDESYRLYAGKTVKSKDDDDDDPDELPETYNVYVAISTQQNHAEFGLLNTENMSIELYDKNTGLMSQILQLPEDAAVWDMFNFAYANGIYWLFDKENRKWVGYK